MGNQSDLLEPPRSQNLDRGRLRYINEQYPLYPQKLRGRPSGVKKGKEPLFPARGNF